MSSVGYCKLEAPPSAAVLLESHPRSCLPVRVDTLAEHHPTLARSQLLQFDFPIPSRINQER
jgi:hypothetical protein